MTKRATDHRRRLVRLWQDLGLSRRDAQRAADEDLSMAGIFKRQGMTARKIRAALAEIRSAFDVFVIDPRTGRRRIRFGPSIFDVMEKRTPEKRRPTRKPRTKKGGA